MEDLDYWTQGEIKSIEKILREIHQFDRRIVEHWFISPKNLENTVGKENYNFIRTIWQKYPIDGILSYNIFNIIFINMFNKWTEEDYAESVEKKLKIFLNRYGDWWEKPIIKKWFASKTILINKFGKETAASLIASLYLGDFLYDDSNYAIPPKEMPKDGIFLTYYKIIDKIREHIPGNKEVLNWKNKYLKKLDSIAVFLYFIIFISFIIFLIILFLTENDEIIFFSFFILLIIIFFGFLAYLLVNWITILKHIANIWYKIFVISLISIYINYIFYIFVVTNYIYYLQDAFFWYMVQWTIWIISIISYKMFRKKALFGQKKITSGNIFFYIVSFNYLIVSIILFFLDWLGSFDLWFYELLWEIILIMIVLIIFTTQVKNTKKEGIFHADIWIRRKLLNPLKIYKDLDFLNDFAQALSDLTDHSVEEILKKLDISKSIEENCKQFGFNFRRDINQAFDIIIKHKREIFKIIPNCPTDIVCPVLEQKLNEFDQDFSKNISRKDIDLSILGLRVNDKLPENVKNALERAESHFKTLKFCNDDSFGFCILELTKSLEGLFKILMHEFVSRKEAINYSRALSGDSRIQKDLPIVSLIKNGVEKYTLGSFLYIIQETYSYPENCKIKKELLKYIQENLPVDIADIKKLKVLVDIRNDYAHSPGEIIPSEQYFASRELVIRILNFLKIDLSNIDFKIMIPPKLMASS